MQIRRTDGGGEVPGAGAAAPGGGAPKAGELSVSEITRRVRQTLEGSPELRDLWIRGEASNVRLAASGHLYFTLKDELAQIRCVYFSFARPGRKPPDEGMAVLVHGAVRVYERAGEYQLLCDDIIKAGKGDLAARFEELKQKLAAEGLFAPERKVTSPPIPRCIAVITSPTTAALQDVLNILRRRAPYLRVMLFPALVQGDGAPPELIAALARADSHPDVEAILLVRGGGSIEDLWCFNDENLARAIAKVNKPLISGVGHEIDFTIADFVADLRAPTPSAAAEMVAPDVADLRGSLRQQGQRLGRAAGRQLEQSAAQLQRLFDRRLIRDVLAQVQGSAQGVDAISERLLASAIERTHGLEALRSGLKGAEGAHWYSSSLQRLAQPLSRGLDQAGRQTQLGQEDLLRAARLRLEALQRGLAADDRRLQSLDPRAPLKLGFALVWQEDGASDGAAPDSSASASAAPGESRRRLVRDPAQVKAGEALNVQTQGGEFPVKAQ